MQQTKAPRKVDHQNQRDPDQFPPQGLGAFEVPQHEVDGFHIGVQLSAPNQTHEREQVDQNRCKVEFGTGA